MSTGVGKPYESKSPGSQGFFLFRELACLEQLFGDDFCGKKPSVLEEALNFKNLVCYHRPGGIQVERINK